MEFNHLPNKSGFKTPQNDMNTFEDRLNKRLFLEDLKSDSFKIPNNYLKDLSINIETKSKQKAKVKPLFNKKLALTVTSIAASIALLITLSLNTKKVSISSIENDTLSNYILNETTVNDLSLLIEDESFKESDFLFLDDNNIEAILNDLDLEDLIEN
jgi:hypothetical protein